MRQGELAKDKNCSKLNEYIYLFLSMLFKRKDVVKSEKIEIRLTTDEKAEVKRIALAEDLPVSELFLRTLRKRKAGKSNTHRIVNKLTELIDAIRTVHEQFPENQEAQKAVLNEVAIVLRDIPRRITPNSE
ncbi:hypothetical protein [Methylovorus glucosotrophus]|uniref:hypothetical protein n=1 Tax=Methylovorus glucosotrophus TaxID=266009 RepID=UPI0011D0DD27|nr:hypothetical protein [Methylovorus glucosotrophus]